MNKKLLKKAKAQLKAKKEAAEKAAQEAIKKGEKPPEVKVPSLPAKNRNAKKSVRASIREANRRKEKPKISWNFQEGDLVQFSVDGKLARGIIINAHFGTQNRQNPKLSSDYSSYLEVISTIGKTSVRPKYCKLIQRVQNDDNTN